MIYDFDVVRWPNEYTADNQPIPIFEGDTDGSGTYYTVPAEAGLQPGETYYYRVTARTEADEGTGSVIAWFSTGPLCSGSTSLQPPTLIYPPDGSSVYFPDTVDLEWDNEMTCWPAGDFFLEISTTEDFSAPVWYGTTHYLESVWIQNDPPPVSPFVNCTHYYWRVRADPAGGGEGPYSETWSFTMNRTPLFCPIIDIPVVITYEPHWPFAEVKTSASCRSGPTLDYPVIDYLEVGESVPVEGRNEDSSWWYILSPRLQSGCWVSGLLVELTGDGSQVPVVAAPPLVLPGPTDTPFPVVTCSSYTDPNSCIANGCNWHFSTPNQPNAGFCTNP
jgi:uncharacterized protein YraI